MFAVSSSFLITVAVYLVLVVSEKKGESVGVVLNFNKFVRMRLGFRAFEFTA